MAIKAIIFDCDGTLVDSEILSNEILVEYLSKLGHTLSLQEATDAYTGVKMAECVLDLERRFEAVMPEDFVTVFRERMSDAFSNRLRPVVGARELIMSLDCPVHIASSGPRQKILGSLKTTNLHTFFSGEASIFSAYEIGHWKPDP